MAYLEARAAIARAGVTYAGWADPVAVFTVGGTDRSGDVDTRTFQIQAQLEQATTATFRIVKGAAPTVGQEVVIKVCTPDEYLFAGYLLRVSVTRIDVNADPFYDCEVVDYTWLLDRYQRVWGKWQQIGINTLVRTILSRFTLSDDGFAAGSIPSSLGTIDEFTGRGETVSDTLTRLAKQVGGYWRINLRSRTIDVFTPGGDNDGNAPTWGNSSDLKQLTLTTDATQLRTRNEVVGGGAGTTEVLGGGLTGSQYVGVDETGWYKNLGLGTRLRPDYQRFQPSGAMLFFSNDKSTESGPGDIYMSPPADDIPSGTTIAVVGYVDDTPTAYETAWGNACSLTSGLVFHLVQDGRMSAAECQSYATADIAMFCSPVKTITYTTTNRWARLGQYICASITSPVAVQGTFVCQQMTMTPRRVDGTNVEWYKRVTAGPYRRDLSDLLRRG